MADRPSVTLKINATGGAGAVDQLDDVAAAQDRVADATADAAKAAAAQGDAGAKAESKLKKLWEGLKAGAGAAAGAAAGLTGMAVTLKGQLSPEVQTTVAALQGLSGVLAAFGPVGALASVAVSGVAAAIAAFDGEAEKAYEVSRTLSEEWRALGNRGGFLAQTMGRMAAEAQDLGDRFNRLKKAREGSEGLFGVSDAEVPEQWRGAAQAMQAMVDDRTAALKESQKEIDLFRAGVANRDIQFHRQEMARLEATAEARRKSLLDAKLGLEGVTKQWKAFSASQGPLIDGGFTPTPPPPPRAVSTAPRAPDDSIERSVAFFVRQAEMAQANLVGAFTAATALAEHEAARVAEASAAAAAQYSDQIARVIAAGASAQQDAIRRTEEDAARLIGIYDDLTIGVSDFGKAAGEGFAAAAVSAAIYGGSLKDAANQALQAATVTAATEALIATAKGLGYLAAGAFGYAPGIAAAQASFAAAGVWAGIAGGAALGAAATGGFGGGGGGGGVGSLGPDAGGPPTALDRPAAAEAPQDREFFINLNSGAGGGKPLSRGDAGAIATALVDIFRAGGMRLEARRA